MVAAGDVTPGDTARRLSRNSRPHSGFRLRMAGRASESASVIALDLSHPYIISITAVRGLFTLQADDTVRMRIVH